PRLLHLSHRAKEQSMSQTISPAQRFESRQSLASLPSRRGSFQTKAPSPQAPQTAPVPADYVHPSAQGYPPRTLPRQSHTSTLDPQSYREEESYRRRLA